MADTMAVTQDTLARSESEERFAKAFDLSPVGMIISSIPDGRMIDVNEAFCRMVGYSRAELVGRTTIEMALWVNPLDRQALIERTRREGSVRDFEIRYRTRSGAIRVLLASQQQIVLAGADCLLTTAMDITERKQHEVEVRQVGERLALAQRTAKAGVWDWDITLGRLFWSDEFFDLFGLDPATTEASFDNWRAALHPEDLAMAEARIDEAVRQRTRLFNRYRIVLASGEVRWIDAFGDTTYDDQDRPLRMTGICVDVTERKATESRLQLAQEIFDSASEAIFVSDLAGNLVDVNAEACRLAKYTRAEMLRLRNVDIVTQDEAPRIEGELARCDAGGVVENRWLLLCSDGSTVPLDLVVQRLPGDRYLAIGRDLTEREKVLRQLAAAHDAAQAADRAKTRFLAAASHDLRQPIQAIKLFQHALGRTAQTPEQRQLGAKLAESVNSLGDILDALLDVSKLDAGVVIPRPEVFPVEEVFRRLDSDFSDMASTVSLRFKFFIPLGELAFFCDPKLLLRLLGNLVDNAIRYTDRGGVLVGIRRRGDRALIQVWDTGIGIAREHTDAIFEEYFQVGNVARDRAKGLGLGLSIVRRLARLLDTQVVCRSRPGKGTVFEFSLPLSSEPAGAGRREKAPGPDVESSLAGRHLVVIEDNVAVAEAMHMAMQSLGVRVTRFASAEDALAGEGIADADLYVSDFRLPGMNGLQLLDAIQERSAKPIRAVLLTGDTSPGRIELTRRSRWTVLFKPFVLDELIAALAADHAGR